MGKVRMPVGFFFIAAIWKGIMRQRSWDVGVVVGRKWKCQRKKRSWRKRETERSLRPHNVCFLSVSSVWSISGGRRTLLCRRLARVFCLERQLVARPCCGGRRPIWVTRITDWTAGQLTSSEFCVPTPLELPSEPMFSKQNRLDKSFLSSCLFIPCQRFLQPFLLLLIIQDLCVSSTSSYLFTPCVPIQSNPTSPLSHTAEVYDVSCASDSGQLRG